MPRSLVLANGSLLVNFDQAYQLRDVYYPHIAAENHTLGGTSRLGLWIDGNFSWLSDWPLDLRYEPDSLTTDVRGTRADLGVEIQIHDGIDFDSNVLIRQIILRNLSAEGRRVRLFVHFDPYIGETAFGNAAYFDAGRRTIVCHKGQRFFLLGSAPLPVQYAVGRKGASLEGVWRDAEDGALSNNATATGAVDAILLVELDLPASGSATAHAWLAVGEGPEEIQHLDAQVRVGPGALLPRTRRFWRYWLHKARGNFGDLSPAVAALYRRSLLMVRAHQADNGAIIAAVDSDILSYGQDTYGYVWPRDAAIVANVLDLAGYSEVAHRFFEFLPRLIPDARTDDPFGGVMRHRYSPTGGHAPSWHPRVNGEVMQLPIQEDETALVLHALCDHLHRVGDHELARVLYYRFVRPAADFLLVYRDVESGLPRPSFDLWEETHAISLFTCVSVWAGLDAVARLADELGDDDAAAQYREGAAEVRAAVEAQLFDPQRGRFAAFGRPREDGSLELDPVVDSSMAAIFVYGLLPADDARVSATMAALGQELTNAAPAGGLARHGNDIYQHLYGHFSEYQGNTWFVSTLWYADWLTAVGRRGEARAILEWCAVRALPSGVLAEQLHPHTGAALSVSPLTWSHAAFVASVERYLR
jgi:GH15 family glucan-1,4-alpha-glucosidase